MPKKPIKDEDSSIEEVDLSALEIASGDFFELPKKEEPPKKVKRMKDEFEEEMDILAEEEIFDDKDLIIPAKGDDADFDDFEDFDEFEDEDLMEEDEDGVPKKRERGLARMPVDRSLDKRRLGKGLQKFIDVTVPQEFLEGLDDNMQLLFKKGKAE